MSFAHYLSQGNTQYKDELCSYTSSFGYKLCLSFGSCKDELCSLSLFVVKAKHKTPNIRMSFAHTQQEEVQQAASEVL